jgi:hypothetical protein
MDTLQQQIRTSRKIKDSSLKTYMCALKTLKNKIQPNGGMLNGTDFLYDFNRTMNVINNEKTITSKKNKLTAILVALNSDTDKDTELIAKYSKELKQLNDEYLTFLKQQTKTDTQRINWLTYDELIGVLSSVVAEYDIHRINQKDKLNRREYDILQQLIILFTYMEFPLRNDFADMRVVTKKQYANISANEQKRFNYLIIEQNGKKSFHINQFKNQKAMGSKIYDVPTKLSKLMDIWLKHNKSEWYLTKSDRATPMNPNGITKFLNKIFQRYTSKKISTSMLRHIIISHMLKDTPTIAEVDAERQKIENLFLHSKGINELYRKVDD